MLKVLGMSRVNVQKSHIFLPFSSGLLAGNERVVLIFSDQLRKGDFVSAIYFYGKLKGFVFCETQKIYSCARLFKSGGKVCYLSLLCCEAIILVMGLGNTCDK